jgi:hypothetical protein
LCLVARRLTLPSQSSRPRDPAFPVSTGISIPLFLVSFPSTHAVSELIDPPQTEVDDRLFSTSVDLKYDIQLPPNVPLTIANIPKIDKFADFQNVYEKTRQATLEVFATDESASVQATMYKTAQRVLLESPSIKSVTYAYPNKHYM